MQRGFEIDPETIVSELVTQTKHFERVFFPSKDFLLSKKMDLESGRSVKQNTEKIGHFIHDMAHHGDHLAIQGLRLGPEATPTRPETAKLFTPEDPVKPHMQIEIGNPTTRLSPERPDETAPPAPVTATPGDKPNEPANVPEEPSEPPQPPLPENKEAECSGETKVDLERRSECRRQSFFGYYNFYNFFSNFVIFYERLKFMKSLTDKQGGFHFMKQLLFLKLTGVIDTELFEDVLGCLLSGQNGVFLNLERILSYVVKEVPGHEMDHFVLDLNEHLFHRRRPVEAGPRTRSENRDMGLFLKTCRKLSQLTVKSKSSCKQSQIQSYINNNNITNDHVLRFEFRLDEQMFVVHKIKSVFRQFPKQVACHRNSECSLRKYTQHAHYYLTSRPAPPRPFYAPLTPSQRLCFKRPEAQDDDRADPADPVDLSIRFLLKNDDNKISCQNQEPNQPQIRRPASKGKAPPTQAPRDAPANVFGAEDALLDLERVGRHLRKRVFIRNEILYSFDSVSQVMDIAESRKEEKLFACRPRKSEEQTRRARLKMLAKSRKFREIIARRG